MFTFAAGLESDNDSQLRNSGSNAVRVRLKLSGGIPLRALRITEIRDIRDSDPYFDDLCDTWLLDDLRHDLYAKDFESEFDVLAATVQLLQKSKTAKSLINDAVSQDWQLGLADLGDNAFHVDVPTKKIVIGSNGLQPDALSRSVYFRNAMLATLARALRDLWHEKRQGGFDVKFGPEGILMLERVRAADCDVMTTLMAWELREAGAGDMWRHLLASDEGDLAIAFGCMMEKATTRSVHPALAAAFDQWYRVHDRVMQCDHQALEYIDNLMRSGAHINTRRAAIGDVELISCLPDKTAYLQGQGANILCAPLYAGLHDAVNQSHYLQIMHDLSVVNVQGVPFRDAGLAAKIFPNGQMTEDRSSVKYH